MCGSEKYGSSYGCAVTQRSWDVRELFGLCCNPEVVGWGEAAPRTHAQVLGTVPPLFGVGGLVHDAGAVARLSREQKLFGGDVVGVVEVVRVEAAVPMHACRGAGSTPFGAIAGASPSSSSAQVPLAHRLIIIASFIISSATPSPIISSAAPHHLIIASAASLTDAIKELASIGVLVEGRRPRDHVVLSVGGRVHGEGTR